MGAIYRGGVLYGGGDSNAIHWSEASRSVKKNLLPNNATSQTINGVTFTVNSDGSVTVNGTATALIYFVIASRILSDARPHIFIPNGTYILSGTPNNDIGLSIRIGVTKDGSYLKYGDDTGSGFEFIVAGDDNSSDGAYPTVTLNIPNGATVSNKTFYPMLRLASIADDTYEPYIPDNTELVSYKDNAILGAKNLLVNERGNSTIEGVTFVVNADGTVTASGTPSNNNAFYDFYNPTRVIGKIPAGRYIFSGTPSGIDTTKYNMYVEIGGPGNNLYDYGNGVTFDYNGTDTLRFVIGIRTSAVSNLTFKPVLRLASDPDDTYVPYAMTNRELTVALQSLNIDLQTSY